MTQPAFLSLAYFPGENDIAAIEERLMTAEGADWFRSATVMAWYCRQEPSDRPLDLVLRIQDLLPNAGLDPREETAIRGRLELIRAEIAWTRSDYDEADRLYRAAMALAESMNDLIAYGDALCGLAFCLRQCNEPVEASIAAARAAYMKAGDQDRAAFAQFILAAMAAHDNAAAAFARYGASIATEQQENSALLGPYIKAYRARIAMLRGDINTAVRFWSGAYELALGSAQYCQATCLLMMLGECHFALHDYDAALECFNRAVELGRGLQSKLFVAMNLGNIGDVMRALKRTQEAREFLELTLQNWQGSEKSRWYLLHLIYLAEVTLDLGESAAALQLFDDAILQIGRAGVVQPLDRAMIGKARALLALDQLEEAFSVAEQALLIGHDTAALPNRIEALRTIAMIFRRRGDLDNALSIYASAEAIAAGIEGYALSAALFNEIGATHSERGNFREAYDYALKAQMASDSTRLKEAGNRVIALRVRETECAQ